MKLRIVWNTFPPSGKPWSECQVGALTYLLCTPLRLIVQTCLTAGQPKDHRVKGGLLHTNGHQNCAWERHLKARLFQVSSFHCRLPFHCFSLAVAITGFFCSVNILLPPSCVMTDWAIKRYKISLKFHIIASKYLKNSKLMTMKNTARL